MSAKVSVYWLSLHRVGCLRRAVETFIERTAYPDIELIIVDCSPPDSEVRDWIRACGYFDQIIFRDRQYCMWNNSNVAFTHCSGRHILHLENDIEIIATRPDWLSLLIEELEKDHRLAISLAIDADDTEAHSLGFVTSRYVRQAWHPWKCFPDDYVTISESIDLGDRARKESFLSLGFRARGSLALRHNLSAPSLNLTKMHRLYGVDYTRLDSAMQAGVRVVRMQDAGYVDYKTYLASGSWQACDWLLASEDGGAPPRKTILEGLIPSVHFVRKDGRE